MVLCSRSLALLALVAFAQAETPRLRHGAPRLGQSCTITLEGASPGAALVLLQSPLAAQVTTPYGLLELERSTTTLLAHGSADASGAFDVTVQLPADPALAERPWHLQVLVRGAGGAQLSSALHLRWVGPRAYVAFRGGLAGGRELPGGLSIVSLALDALVTEVDYGFFASAGPQSAEPVLHVSLASGAIQASASQLVLFDPFFGGVRAILPCESASRALYTDASGTRLYLLEGVPAGGSATARIRVLDLESGAVLATIPLLGAGHVERWTVDPERGIAYVACEPAADARPALERVDLGAGTSRGLVPIGLPTCRRVRALEHAFGRVVVATDDDALEQSLGALTRLRETSAGPLVTLHAVEPVVRGLVELEASEALLVWSVPPALGPFAFLELERPAGGVGLSLAPLPEWSFPLAIEAGPRGVWVLSTDGLGDPWRFSHCALPGALWSTWPTAFDGCRPTAIGVEVGAGGERLCIATAGLYAPGFEVEPRLRLFDPSQQGFRHVPVGTEPESVRVE